MSLTQAEMEARYDAERNGTLYDLPISAVEQQIVNILLQHGDDAPEDTDSIIAILEECDGGERRQIDERFDRVIDQVAELPDAQRQIAVSLWEGFVAGVAIGNAVQTAPLGKA